MDEQQAQQELTFTMHADGRDVTCTVLFTFYSDETQAHYMLYTPDDPATATGQLQISAARYDPDQLSALYPLQGDKDREIVQSFIDYVCSHDPQELAQAQQELDSSIQTVEDL